MTTTPEYDLVHELGFDGDLGSILSVDAHGHLPFEDAELFLADVVEREIFDYRHGAGPVFGLEIEHVWRSTHRFVPDDGDEHEDEYGERWSYEYATEETAGSIAVTRFQIASPWSRAAVSPTADRAERDRRTGDFLVEGVDHFPVMCCKHPDELAVTGIPSARFTDPDPAYVLDGHVHYCKPCHEAFNDRIRIATERAMAPIRVEEYLGAEGPETISIVFGHPLLRSDLTDVHAGNDSDGGRRRRLAAFADAYETTLAQLHRPVVTAMPGYKVLMLSDIRHLVADFTHRAV